METIDVVRARIGRHKGKIIIMYPRRCGESLRDEFTNLYKPAMVLTDEDAQWLIETLQKILGVDDE